MMTNLPMPGEAQSPANYMKQVRLCAQTRACACACVRNVHVRMRMQVDHAACVYVCAYAYVYVYMCMCMCVCVHVCICVVRICNMCMCMICVYMCGRAGGHAGRFAAAVHVDHGPEELGRRHHVLVRRLLIKRRLKRRLRHDATCAARPRLRLRLRPCRLASRWLVGLRCHTHYAAAPPCGRRRTRATLRQGSSLLYLLYDLFVLCFPKTSQSTDRWQRSQAAQPVPGHGCFSLSTV